MTGVQKPARKAAIEMLRVCGVRKDRAQMGLQLFVVGGTFPEGDPDRVAMEALCKQEGLQLRCWGTGESSTAFFPVRC